MMKHKRKILAPYSFFYLLVLIVLLTGLGCRLTGLLTKSPNYSHTPVEELISTLNQTPSPSVMPSLPSTLTPLPTNTPFPTSTITPTSTPPPTPVVKLNLSISSGSASPSGVACFGSKEYGISCLDDTGWKTFTSTNSGLLDNHIYAISACQDQRILVAFRGGLQTFDGSTWSKVSPVGLDKPIKAICDPNKGFWAAQPQNISRYNGKTWSSYPLAENTKLNGKEDFLQDIALAPDGKLWTITSSQVSRFDGSAWQVFDPEKKPNGKYIYTKIIVDNNGNPWVASPGGLFTYQEGHWKSFFQPALPAPGSLAIDPQKMIWIGTLSGIFTFQDGNWDVLESAENALGSAAVLAAAFDENGRLWAATARGITVFDGKTWTTYRMDNSPLLDNQVTSLMITAGGPLLPAPLPKQNGKLSGRILSGGNPLGLIRLQLCVEPLGSAYTGDTPCENQAFHRDEATDGLGDFTFKDLPAGRYQLIIENGKGNWTTLNSETGEPGFVLINPDRDTFLGTVEVEPKPGPPTPTVSPTP